MKATTNTITRLSTYCAMAPISAGPMPVRAPNGPAKSTKFKKVAAAGTIATMAIYSR
ncbi:hypothetical protein D3C83_42090 [compost metagenome]